MASANIQLSTEGAVNTRHPMDNNEIVAMASTINMTEISRYEYLTTTLLVVVIVTPQGTDHIIMLITNVVKCLN